MEVAVGGGTGGASGVVAASVEGVVGSEEDLVVGVGVEVVRAGEFAPAGAGPSGGDEQVGGEGVVDEVDLVGDAEDFGGVAQILPVCVRCGVVCLVGWGRMGLTSSRWLSTASEGSGDRSVTIPVAMLGDSPPVRRSSARARSCALSLSGWSCDTSGDVVRRTGGA